MAAVSAAAAAMPIPIIKPGSGGSNSQAGYSRPLSTGSTRIQITQVSESTVNPEPIKLVEDVELLDEFLSPRKLRALTGVDDLEEVTYLEMQVDTGGASLGNFGMHLPCLRQLKLTNSIIPSIRDLGTSLNCLEVLWMPQCCLECLDGLATMHSIKELYLAYNELQDVSPCGMLENLEILDLEGNLIDDISHLAYLAICPALSKLTLEGNPICKSPTPDEPAPVDYEYRAAVCQSIPQLLYLDDLATTCQDDVPEVRQATLQFDEHWAFINDVLVESGLLSDSKDSGHRSPDVDSGLPSSVGRPSTGMASGRLGTAEQRPGSALRPSSALKRMGTAGGRGVAVRPGTGQRLNSASGVRPASGASGHSGQDGEALDATDESILTAGVVVCGSISKALRHRRTGRSPAPDTPGTPDSSQGDHSQELYRRLQQQSRPQTAAAVSSRPLSGSSISSRREQQLLQLSERPAEEVFADLRNWKSRYERTRAEVAAERAPQILRITHDESFDVELGEDEEIDSGAEEDMDLELMRAAAFRPSKTRFGVNQRHTPGLETTAAEPKVIVASKQFPSPPGSPVRLVPQPPPQPPPGTSSRPRLTSPSTQRLQQSSPSDRESVNSKFPNPDTFLKQKAQEPAHRATARFPDPSELFDAMPKKNATAHTYTHDFSDALPKKVSPMSATEEQLSGAIPKKTAARMPDPEELLAALPQRIAPRMGDPAVVLPRRPATATGVNASTGTGAVLGPGGRLRRVQLPSGGAALPSKPTLPK